jgi:hypothetical protein
MDRVRMSTRPVIRLVKVHFVVAMFVQELARCLVKELEIQTPSKGLTHVAPRPETPEPTTATFMNMLVMHDGEKEEKVCHDTYCF